MGGNEGPISHALKAMNEHNNPYCRRQQAMQPGRPPRVIATGKGGLFFGLWEWSNGGLVVVVVVVWCVDRWG